jgi:hypothetical protein
LGFFHLFSPQPVHSDIFNGAVAAVILTPLQLVPTISDFSVSTISRGEIVELLFKTRLKFSQLYVFGVAVALSCVLMQCYALAAEVLAGGTLHRKSKSYLETRGVPQAWLWPRFSCH